MTSLMEGSVKVTSGTKERLIKPDEMVVLDHGDLKVTPIEDYNVYRWKEGLICFKDETFVNIMSKFETCYGVTIKSYKFPLHWKIPSIRRHLLCFKGIAKRRQVYI